MNKPKISIFTPTFNRANLLPQLYESLKRQTNKDFIWLIIDDGSTDNTKQLVKKWEAENKVTIQYVYKENGGKHTAIDLSNQVCQTEYICCCDSDDFLTDDAVEVIYYYIEQYGADEEVVGFVGRRKHINPLSNQNDNWNDRNAKVLFYDFVKNINYVGETVLIFKTDIIKNYHFPVFEGEKFVTESVFYQQFLYQYKMVTMMEKIQITAYQPDGYTSQGTDLFFKNPKGFLYSERANAFYSIKYGKGLKYKIRMVATYYYWQKVLKLKVEQCKKIRICFPFNILGKLASIIFLKKYKNEYKNYLSKRS